MILSQRDFLRIEMGNAFQGLGILGNTEQARKDVTVSRNVGGNVYRLTG